jgi:hypothetical protein
VTTSPDAEIPDPGQRRPERVAVVEERAERQVHERCSRSVGDIGADARVRGTGERDRSQKLAGADMAAARRLQRWRIDVEVEVVIDARVRTRFEAFRAPQGRHFVAGAPHPHLGQQRAEGMRDVGYADHGRRDRRGELGRVVDHQLGPPRPHQRQQVGKRCRHADLAEELRESEIRPLVRRQLVDLGVAAPEPRPALRLRQAGAHGIEPGALHSLAPVRPRRPADIVAPRPQRSGERHQRVDVTDQPRRRNKHSHRADLAGAKPPSEVRPYGDDHAAACA